MPHNIAVRVTSLDKSLVDDGFKNLEVDSAVETSYLVDTSHHSCSYVPVSSWSMLAQFRCLVEQHM